MICPCGSQRAYAECCEPYHQGGAARTPELLMRSRYSAFALGLAEYLSSTWHVSTRPRLDLSDNPHWVKLEVLAHSHVASEHPCKEGETGFVHFKVYYQQPGGLLSTADCLEEHSRFIFEGGRWWYVDGKIL